MIQKINILLNQVKILKSFKFIIYFFKNKLIFFHFNLGFKYLFIFERKKNIY
jgi:hypothetical protein